MEVTNSQAIPMKELDGTTDLRDASDAPLIDVDINNVSEERATWKSGDPFRHPLPESNEDPWGILYNNTKNYDKGMCSAWKDEIEKHLVFAGLFSAAVTTFVVDSYKNLATDQEAEMVQLLIRISLQLDRITANGSSQIPPLPDANLSTASADIRVNIAWFLSLTLSLTTVLVGIICLQWLREYERYGSMPPKDALSLRQMRYEGLKIWYLPTIISSIPVLLQVALILFFVGIIDQLWNLEHAVAIPIIVASGFLFMFMLATTILPVFQCFYAQFCRTRFNISQCPYKSPQSFAVRWLGMVALWPFLWGGSLYSVYKQRFRQHSNNDMEVQVHNFDGTHQPFPRLTAIKEIISVDSWADYDTHWMSRRESGESNVEGRLIRGRAGDDVANLCWSRRKFDSSHESMMAVCHCFSALGTIRQRKILEQCKIKIAWLEDPEIQASNNLVRDIHCFYFFFHLSMRNKSVRMSLEQHYIELYIRIRTSLKNPNLIDATYGFNPFFLINYTDAIVAQLFLVIETFVQSKKDYGFDAGRFILQYMKLEDEKGSSISVECTQRLENFNQGFITRLLKSRSSKDIIECLRYIFKLRKLDWNMMFDKYPHFMVQYITLLCCTERLARSINPTAGLTITLIEYWKDALSRMKAVCDGQHTFSPCAQELAMKGMANVQSLLAHEPASGLSGDERWRSFYGAI